MENTNPKLTSSEIGHLWITYMADGMAACCSRHFLKKCEDNEISSILEYALHLSKKHVGTVKELFQSENIPLPIGFTEEGRKGRLPCWKLPTYSITCKRLKA